MKSRPVLIVLAAIFSACPLARAEEGMWLYSNPPRQQLKDKYGFDVTEPWLDHLMKSSVRFNPSSSVQKAVRLACKYL
jgi:hypothetical protein